MLKTWISDENKSELPDIRQPKHVEKLWSAISSAVPAYIDSLLKPAVPEGDDLLAALSKNDRFRIAVRKPDKHAPKVDFARLARAIEDYDKLAEQYRVLFSEDALAEYRDNDPDAFKSEMSKKCPVIRMTLQSGHDELKEWKIKYRGTSSEVLLETVTNLVALGNEYVAGRGAEAAFAAYDAPDQFEMVDFNEETTGISGVIGGGIKTTILHHLNARVFASRSSTALYGLYFLSGKSPLGLRSGTSEFLMIDDKKLGRDLNMRQDHNYWYPYELSALYSIRLFRLLERASSEHGYPLDPEFRFVYVHRLLEHVCDEHAADLKVMKGVDELSYMFG